MTHSAHPFVTLGGVQRHDRLAFCAHDKTQHKNNPISMQDGCRINTHLFAFPLSRPAIQTAVTLKEGFWRVGGAWGRRRSCFRWLWILLYLVEKNILYLESDVDYCSKRQRAERSQASVCTHLSMSVILNVAGRDHMTDGIGLHSHFLLHQKR